MFLKERRDLDISPSTVHNIIKRFKESGGISVRKGQGPKPKLNNRDLRSLRRHCIKNRHSSISDITTWAQDYFGKPLSSTTMRNYIHKCQLKLYCAKKKPYVNHVQKRHRLLWAWDGPSHSGNVYCDKTNQYFRSFLEEMDPCASDQRRKGPSRLLPATSPKARVCHGNLQFCYGTINAEKYFNKTMQNYILHTFQRHG